MPKFLTVYLCAFFHTWCHSGGPAVASFWRAFCWVILCLPTRGCPHAMPLHTTSAFLLVFYSAVACLQLPTCAFSSICSVLPSHILPIPLPHLLLHFPVCLCCPACYCQRSLSWEGGRRRSLPACLCRRGGGNCVYLGRPHLMEEALRWVSCPEALPPALLSGGGGVLPAFLMPGPLPATLSLLLTEGACA